MRTDWSSWRGVGRSVTRNISGWIPRAVPGIRKAGLLLSLGLVVAVSQQGLAEAATLRPGPLHGPVLSQARAGSQAQLNLYEGTAVSQARTIRSAEIVASVRSRSGASAKSANTARSVASAKPRKSTSAGASARQGNIAAVWALRQRGKPYRWAAAGPNAFDCSGLTMRAWEQAGVHLGHFTGSQWTSGPHIPLKALRRGDLVFFASNTAKPATIHHVGIYIGGGKMVDAPYTGVNVRIDTIHEPGLIGATRPA